MSGEADRLHVGVLGGTRLPGNIKAFLQNVRDLLRFHPVAFDWLGLSQGPSREYDRFRRKSRHAVSRSGNGDDVESLLAHALDHLNQQDINGDLDARPSVLHLLIEVGINGVEPNLMATFGEAKREDKYEKDDDLASDQRV